MCFDSDFLIKEKNTCLKENIEDHPFTLKKKSSRAVYRISKRITTKKKHSNLPKYEKNQITRTSLINPEIALQILSQLLFSKVQDIYSCSV